MLVQANVKGYAVAIFELVKEQNKFKVMHQDMETLLKIINQNPEFIAFLSNEFIAKKERLDLIDQVLDGLDKLVINTVKVALERRSILYLKKIVTQYLKQSNEEMNISFVKVITPEPISEVLLDKIRIRLETDHGNTFEVVNVVNPSLISGFQIVSDSKIIQDNYLNDLNKLSNAIVQNKIKEVVDGH